MTPRFDRHLAAATDAFNAGFSSKAAQKAALDSVNRAADEVKGRVHEELLTVARDDRTDDWADLYYGFPAVHVWKAKHQASYVAFPEAVSAMDQLAALRQSIKDQPIVPPVKDADKVRVETVRTTILDLIEKRKAQFRDGIKMVEVFGKLPVTVSGHYVTNEHGTTFPRYFFYLAGKLTPLNVILAIVDATREEDA